ncbi:MAG: plastocyanin/azurin family copper-binding protein, partial [Chthoniobacteraceae bacterium]
RVLCYWRDRIPDALTLLRIAVTDDAPRVRLEAVRAASFFRQWEAADIALLALTKPTDYYLDYCLKETMKQLEPWWRPAISEGKPVAANNPGGVDYVLSGVSSADLAKLPKSAVVYTAMLTRDDVPDTQRMEALAELAQLNKLSAGKTLLSALQPIAARGGKPVEALARMILMQPAAELKDLRPELVKLGENRGAPAALRRSAIAATILADGSIASSWQTASRSPQAQTDWLEALHLVPDPALRAAAYATVQPLVAGSPAATEKGPAATAGRYVRIELPRKGTLTLAEVEVFSDGKNIAPTGKAKQSSVAYSGEPGRAIDGGTDGAYGSNTQTHTKENESNPWWELDLGQEVPIESIKIWNRSEKNGEYAARLDGFDLKVLDENRNEVFAAKKNPAPAESSTIAVGGDPAGALERAAIRALVTTGQEPATTFATLAQLISSGRQLETAAQEIRRIPQAVWDQGLAGKTVSSLITWANSVPAPQRTEQSFLETVQVASDLAGLMPAPDAQKARRALRDLGVSVFVIKTVREQMRYDTPRLVVEAGKPFAVIFENLDAMPHNIVFVRPGTRQAVAEAVQTMRPDELDKKGRAYIPLADHRVLDASKLIEPGDRVTLNLTAPDQEGEYEYVCTFPGHWMLMWGRLIVTKDVDAYLAANPVAPPTGPSAVLPAEHEHH